LDLALLKSKARDAEFEYQFALAKKTALEKLIKDEERRGTGAQQAQKRQQQYDALLSAVEHLERADLELKRYQVELDAQQKMVRDMQKGVEDCRELVQERDRLGQLKASLKDRFEQVELAGNVIGGTVEEIDRARPPKEPIGLRINAFVSLWAVGGLLVGFAFAYWRDRRDTSLRS
jgi:uncharacterized protein involved in exopolysaccharide biosynthesis